MTDEERALLNKEWLEITQRLKGEHPSPKDMRRKDEITSLLMTNGESSTVKFSFLKGRDSKRVTSFTRNRK